MISKQGNRHINDIDKARQNIMAIHTNMQVCSANIKFDSE